MCTDMKIIILVSCDIIIMGKKNILKFIKRHGTNKSNISIKKIIYFQKEKKEKRKRKEIFRFEIFNFDG